MHKAEGQEQQRRLHHANAGSAFRLAVSTEEYQKGCHEQRRDDERVDHEEIVEIARSVRQDKRYQEGGNEKGDASLVQRRARHLDMTAANEEQPEEVLAEKVERVKEALVKLSVEADEQAEQRHRQAGPRGGPVLQRPALD